MPLILLPPRSPSQSPLGGNGPPPGASSIPPETKLDRLLKLIPTEVIAAYPAALALAATIAWPYYELTIAALGLLAVVLVLRNDGARLTPPATPTLRQYVLRALAFAAWTLVIGNPLGALGLEAAHAHVAGAVGAVFIPLLGYLSLPEAPPPSPSPSPA
jgi:hypothetical protein